MNPIMTIEEAQAAERAARERFEQNTVAFEIDGQPVTMAEARQVFEKYHPGDDWKRPVDSFVAYDDVEKFMLAIQFYQGCSPRARVNSTNPVGFVRVVSPGYSC